MSDACAVSWPRVGLPDDAVVDAPEQPEVNLEALKAEAVERGLSEGRAEGLAQANATLAKELKQVAELQAALENHRLRVEEEEMKLLARVLQDAFAGLVHGALRYDEPSLARYLQTGIDALAGRGDVRMDVPVEFAERAQKLHPELRVCADDTLAADEFRVESDQGCWMSQPVADFAEIARTLMASDA